MSDRPRVVVIGAGAGGIAAAARLARLGCAVTVFEMNARSGGRCGQLLRDGHRFDIGPTLLLMPELFRATYADLGTNLEDHLELQQVDPTYRMYFEDGARLSLPADLGLLRERLETFEPGSYDALGRYLLQGKQHYELSLRHFVGRNFLHLMDYFNPRSAYMVLVKLHALRKHYANVGRYFNHPHLRAAFSFQNMYLGLSPFDAPATYSLLQYTELAHGVWFPKGGLYRVIESLEAIARASGVQFVYDTPVSSIDVQGRRATGVVLDDGRRVAADLVVANADLPYVYEHLLPPSRASHRLQHLQYTCSAFTFYWGVDRTYPQLDTHNVFLAGDYRASFDQIFKRGSLPADPSVYVHAPARLDPTAAPRGEDSLMALVPVGHLGRGQDWEALRAEARAAVMRCLARVGVTDLEQHLKFEVVYSPRAWQSLFNLTRGAAFGLSHGMWQVGYLRPRNRHDHYRNLYFVGASTHPGGGLPVVLESARLTTERIQHDWQLAGPNADHSDAIARCRTSARARLHRKHAAARQRSASGISLQPVAA